MSLADATRSIVDASWITPTVALVREEMRLESGHDESHLVRVLRNARRLLQDRASREASPRADRAVVAAAALTHDLVDLPKDHPERQQASRYSADRALEFFRELEAFTPDQLERIDDAIESHSYSADRTPTSIEARIVCDADRLDAIGAVGIARTFAVSGELGRPLGHPDDPMADRRELDDETYGIDHFYEKLLEVRDRMHTDAGRRLADERHDFLLDFLDQFERETNPGSSENPD